MDLVPQPGQVVAAATNVASAVLQGGLADLRPVPRTLVDEGERRRVYHYRPAATGREHGDPVLLVSPLAAPSSCYDLRRGCSLVEHLVATGRPVYLVEYGEVPPAGLGAGLAPWVRDVIPAAVEAASRHAGDRPVHLVGWSVGGLFALLAVADRPELPVASLAVLGLPLDLSQVPLVAPARPLVTLPETPLLAPLGWALDTAPGSLVRWAAGQPAFDRLVTTPLAVATRLDDADFLAQVEAVDRFTSATTAYRGRAAGRLYHRVVPPELHATGRCDVDGRQVDLADVPAPALVVAGATDGIAPVGAVRAVVPLLTGSAEVRLEIVPGGHLGQLTGREARTTTWPALDEWFAEWSGD